MKRYDKRDLFTHEDYIATAAIIPEKENKYICETAGFVPLEVKLKQFEQNGLIAQFQMADFDSHDMRELYLNPDFDITPEDDFEDVQEKLLALKSYQEEYKKSKKADSSGNDVDAGTEEQTEKNPPAADKKE